MRSNPRMMLGHSSISARNYASIGNNRCPNLYMAAVGEKEAGGASPESSTTKNVLVAVANGSEEIETVCVVDILRRATAEVCLAKVDRNPYGQLPLTNVMSRGVKVEADALLDDKLLQSSFDAIVLPGGLGGANAFKESSLLVSTVKEYLSN